MFMLNRLHPSIILIAFLAVFSSCCLAADVIHTNDGKALKGEIVRETARTIVFRYVDPELGFETTIVVPKSTIVKMDRNVPDEELNAPAAAPEVDDETPSKQGSDEPADDGADDQAASSEEADARQRATTIYVVPMIGQIGTDVSIRVYEEIIEDIKKHQPDVVVFKLDSHDGKDEFNKEPIDAIEGDLTILMDPGERSLWDVDGIRELRTLFDQEISSDIEQVLWIVDAHGDSCVLAMSWPDMYMHPDATLGGMGGYVAYARNAAGDEHVAAKWGDASYHNILGIMNYGRRDNPTIEKLIAAMCKPEYLLSVSWRGRIPMWRNSLKGEVPLDGSDEITVTLPALLCDDLSLSQGTAEEIEDLAVLLGKRNYVVVEGIATDAQKKHTEDWRKAYKTFLDQWGAYRQWLGRGGRSNLTKAEKALTRCIGLVRKWPEVAIRTRANVTDLELLLDEIKRAKRGGNGGRGRGGSGGGGGLAK